MCKLRALHSKFPLQEEGQSGGAESPEGGPFLSWKTDRLLDRRVLPGHWSQDSVENYADLVTVVFRNDGIQEFDSKCGFRRISMWTHQVAHLFAIKITVLMGFQRVARI